MLAYQVAVEELIRFTAPAPHATFRVTTEALELDGVAIPAHEQGWKDTFLIHRNETVSFVAKFADFASTVHPFMYHCHMSNHEDEGLMGQFLVVP